MNVIFCKKEKKIFVQFRNKSEFIALSVHIKEGYLFRQPSFIKFISTKKVYLTSGFDDVSAFGIGSISVWPGLGSAIIKGKYPFFLQRKISILFTSSPASSTALSCITLANASFFVVAVIAGIATPGLARTILI